MANITLIYKKIDPSYCQPISLLRAVRKVQEKPVPKYVFNFFQSGFVSGDSTVNQLGNIKITFCKVLDEGKGLHAIFCDVSKEFHRVWHKAILYYINRGGISGSLLSWFTIYLGNRTQQVVLPGNLFKLVSHKARSPSISDLYKRLCKIRILHC